MKQEAFLSRHRCQTVMMQSKKSAENMTYVVLCSSLIVINQGYLHWTQAYYTDENEV